MMRGSCLCGGVRFELTGRFEAVVHCPAHIFVRSVAPWETLPEDGLPCFDERPS